MLMQPVTIRITTENDEDPGISVASAAELAAALRSISSRYWGEPLLINLYGEAGDDMSFGVGVPYTSIEFVSGDRHYRALGSTPPAPEEVHFFWNGHHTPVWPEHLVPQTEGERAVVAWFERGVLDDAVRWHVSPFPPRVVYEPREQDLRP